MFGDPHFVTLDGKNYTFNGCGWYTYFKGEIPGNIYISIYSICIVYYWNGSCMKQQYDPRYYLAKYLFRAYYCKQAALFVEIAIFMEIV